MCIRDRYAHDHGVVVEGELGRLSGVEDDVKVSADDALYTCLLYTSNFRLWRPGIRM